MLISVHNSRFAGRGSLVVNLDECRTRSVSPKLGKYLQANQVVKQSS
jgi:hypothetical protein